MTAVDWLAVFNPAAGGRRAARQWPVLESALRGAGVRLDVATTRGPGDAETIAAEALTSGITHFLAAGGDGSVHEVVNGLMRARQATATPPTLAPLPLGTGNDWARSLDISASPEALAAVVAADRGVPHDVGRIDFPADGDRVATTRWFVNVAGAGFDAHVIDRLPERMPSRHAYLAGALRELARYRSPAFQLDFDGGARVAGHFLLAFVANARYCGGRMHVAPVALTDDGEFDVVTIDEVGLLRALPKLAKLYGGTILDDPLVRHRRTRSVRIDATPRASIEADGQRAGTTPAVFSVQRHALRVLRGSAGQSAR